MLVSSLVDLIGSTPMVELRRISPSGTRILLKLEYLNPSGSHKDRIALYMIRDAMESGRLREGGYVVEASSGNTAAAVALMAKLMGLRAVLAVPRDISWAKIAMLRALGAEIVFCSDNPSDPDYCPEVAKRVAEERGGVYLYQRGNPANARAHYETTAAEIWRDTGGNIDAFVMGVGTGGTITGIGKYLKERKREIMVVAVTPKGSVLAGGKGEDTIEGLTSGSIPPLLDTSVIDKVVEVSTEEAKEGVKLLAEKEGILAGLSTGANIVASIRVAEELGKGTIVTIAADSLLKYPELLKELWGS
ncbi:MAG: cysteine synthase family protein [Crenarchaeota archaeon]|nr:cysteine synthase family protein [Thermoproteota archaeon]